VQPEAYGMSIQPGQTAGDYEILDLLENSKEGVTYKVRNVILQRFEVLRVLPKTLQDDHDAVTRFLREAQVHARMSHPNIVTFYHATQLNGQLVMTTELVEGTTLAARRELGPLPVAEALSCLSQVLSALGYAHGLGIVHRDVTPYNIILTSDGGVKLTGFGLAKAAQDHQLTQPGTVLGSLNYISPEQIKGSAKLDGRTDIYSTGVVLYEVLTGCRPFHRKSQFELMLAHMSELAPAPSIVNPDVPAELSEIVLMAMAKEPSARFQTAEEFRQRLDPSREARSNAAAAVPTVRAIPPPGQPAGRRPATAWNLRHLLLAGCVTVLVILTFAILQRF
jgi:serine/threonine-protein kinase